MERSSPAVWRSSAVGAGAVALAGRPLVRQLRIPSKAWRAPRVPAWRCGLGGPGVCFLALAGWFVLEQVAQEKYAVKRLCRAEKAGAAPTQNLTSFIRRRALQTRVGECVSSIPSLREDATSIADRLDMEQADGCRTGWSILSLRAAGVPYPGARLPRLRPWPDLLLPGVFRDCARHDPEGGRRALPERPPGAAEARPADGPLPGAEKKSDASAFPRAPLRCSTDIGARHHVRSARRGWRGAGHGLALPILRVPVFRFRAHRLS